MDYVAACIGILIFLNLSVSYLVLKRDDLEVFQKSIQVIIIWLLPFISAFGFWAFYRSQDENQPVKNSLSSDSLDSLGVATSAGSHSSCDSSGSCE